MSGTPTRTTLTPDILGGLCESLAEANAAFASRYPGESGRRQPVHTVYGGAHLFRAETISRHGADALSALELYARDATSFARVLGMPDESELAGQVYRRVVDRLRTLPVEDFRLDFEDGYGNRPDAEEDGHAASAALEVARASRDATLSPGVGIRIKPLTEELRARSLRTLDIFLTTVFGEMGGVLPPNFVVTLPKVTIAEQVRAIVAVLTELEKRLGLAERTLQFEIMVETPQAILGARGISPLPGFLDAAEGRLTGVHFGTYDYTAGCNITAAHQRMRHAACDFARHMMQVAYAGTGVWLSDGSTGVLPVAKHASIDGVAELSAEQRAANERAVHAAWRMHFDDVRHSLVHGFYQGWDLHPAQLPTRYAALYTFFLEGLTAATDRLRNFLGKLSQATIIAEVFDDAATGQALLNYVLRAVNCGAISEERAIALTGLTSAELDTRSFVRILRGRQTR